MFDVALQRVALNVPRQSQLVVPAIDVERDEHVASLQSKHRVVSRQGQMQWIGAVTVEHRRHFVRAAQAAGSSLAELGSKLGSDLDVGHGSTPRNNGGRSGVARMVLRASVQNARRRTTASITEPSNSALAEATG